MRVNSKMSNYRSFFDIFETTRRMNSKITPSIPTTTATIKTTEGTSYEIDLKKVNSINKKENLNGRITVIPNDWLRNQQSVAG